MQSTFSKYCVTRMYAVSVVEQNPAYMQTEVKFCRLHARQQNRAAKFSSESHKERFLANVSQILAAATIFNFQNSIYMNTPACANIRRQTTFFFF